MRPEVIAPNHTTNYPWVLNPDNPAAAASNGVDHLNNQEQVVVTNPAPGAWTVRVKAGVLPSPPQAYSLVFPSARWTAPTVTPGSPPVADAGLSYEALTNGGLETGLAAWDWNGSAVRTTELVHAGGYAARPRPR